jgi:acetylornithine aminotransferase
MTTAQTRTAADRDGLSHNHSIAQALRQDPRVEEARRLLLQALEEHRAQITGIRDPQPELVDGYREMLTAFGNMRGGNLYFPYLGSGLGNGPWVELADGSVKLDFITGIGVHAFGHSDPRLMAAGVDALLCDTVMQGNLQQSTVAVDFTRTLLEITNMSGARLEHCFLSTSGSMANENALKIAFQKHAPADRIIAFERGFAGRTLALAQVTDKASYRDGLPVTVNVDLIPFYDPADPRGSTRRSVQAMRAHATRFPGRHACLWMELVQGEGGYWPGDTPFFRALIMEAQKHKMAIAVDEIQTFGRTSQPWAFQHYQLDPLIDIATTGKMTQVCATLFTADYKPRPGLISQTFTGSSWAFFAGLTIIQGLRDGGHFGEGGRNNQLHNYFAEGLQRLCEKHPRAIHGPFGVGGMIGFTPLQGRFEQARDMTGKLYELGLMSFMAGSNPARVRFLVPLGCVTESHIDEALRIIGQALVELG